MRIHTPPGSSNSLSIGKSGQVTGDSWFGSNSSGLAIVDDYYSTNGIITQLRAKWLVGRLQGSADRYNRFLNRPKA